MRRETPAEKRLRIAQLFACAALLIALLPGLSSSWVASNGGEAERTWSFGVPGSPLLTVYRHGVGPLNEVAWSSPEVSFNPLSLSFPLLLVSSGLLLVLAVRGKPAVRLGREA